VIRLSEGIFIQNLAEVAQKSPNPRRLSCAPSEDREGHHSTIEDALRCAAESAVRNLVLFHVSRRYEPEELVTGVRQLIEKTGLGCPVILIRGALNLPTD